MWRKLSLKLVLYVLRCYGKRFEEWKGRKGHAVTELDANILHM